MKIRTLITALFATAVFAVPASAQDGYVKIVPGYRISDGSADPGNANACTAVVFYRWTKVPGTIAATVTWRGTNGRLGTITSAPPFSDSFPALPSGGKHSQLEASYFRSLGDGAICGSKVTELQAAVPETAKVALTLNECGGASDVLRNANRLIREGRQDLGWLSDIAKNIDTISRNERKQVKNFKARDEDDFARALDGAFKSFGAKGRPSRRAMAGADRGIRTAIKALETNQPQTDVKVLRKKAREAREMKETLNRLSALRIGKKTVKKRLKSTLERRRDAARKRARAC